MEVVRSLPFRTACDFKIQFRDGEIVLHATVRRCTVHGKGRDDHGREVMLYRAGLEFDRPTPGLAALLGAKGTAGRKADDQAKGASHAGAQGEAATGVLTLREEEG